VTLDRGCTVYADGYWVSMPHATFALLVRDGVVVDAPPIARYLIGRTIHAALFYCAGRHARIEPLTTPPAHRGTAPMPHSG
jgi:hypothetical protein